MTDSLAMLEGQTLLITGGTGSFGNAMVGHLLASSVNMKLIVLSRDEMKQWHMAKRVGDDDRVRFFIGDVRDRERLYRAFSGVDYVIHAAAAKIVPTAEYNPFETVKTNVNGAMNVIDAAIDSGVRKVVALSTDKASSPINLYGATKLASDKLFTAGSAYSTGSGTAFSVVRYGNVMSSRGSVIPFFKQCVDQGLSIPITHPDMTRFMIDLPTAVNTVVRALNMPGGGDILVKKSPSVRIRDLAQAVGPRTPTRTVGMRPGEKIHEEMIGSAEAPRTLEFPEFYRIFPSPVDFGNRTQTGAGVAVPPDFRYASDSNPDYLTLNDLETWLQGNSSETELLL